MFILEALNPNNHKEVIKRKKMTKRPTVAQKMRFQNSATKKYGSFCPIRVIEL